MIPRDSLFAQFGAGREGWWKEEVWLRTLRVLAKHEHESYTPSSNPALFEDIQRELTEIGANLTASPQNESRSVFRAARTAWTATDVAFFDGEIRLTTEGHDVISGKRTYSDCLRTMFVSFVAGRNGKNPFRPVLSLMADGAAHGINEVFDAVQSECGTDMRDWQASARIREFPYDITPRPGNQTRSVNFLLTLLVEAGVLRDEGADSGNRKSEGPWRASDVSDVRQLEDAIRSHRLGGDPNGGEDELNFEIGPAIDEIISKGWQFPKWQIATFCHAVKTKPFVVLAGISGTGKTKLPRLVAEATGAQYTLIPVRPDWRDSSDLLGYTDLGGIFHPGPLLRAAKAAIETPQTQHFVLLDEMNLARVEYYFAEVLSLIEERRADSEVGYRTDPLLGRTVAADHETDGMDGLAWSDVYLPANLAIIGSVNMDETTHPFSRKVLDRAFVIEFSDVSLELQDGGSGGVTQVSQLSAADWRPAATRLIEHPLSGSREVQHVVDELITLNKILKKNQLQVGYRLRDEVALFVLNLSMDSHLVDEFDNTIDPLDLALSMKILPRVQGGGPRTGALLTELREWAGPVDSPAFPLCFSRVELLLDRFSDEGFTSYWL